MKSKGAKVEEDILLSPQITWLDFKRSYLLIYLPKLGATGVIERLEVYSFLWLKLHLIWSSQYGGMQLEIGMFMVRVPKPK